MDDGFTVRRAATPSRRAFFHQLSSAAGAAVLLPVLDRRFWATAPTAWLPELDEAPLLALAQRAIEAARASGATFVDVRITAAQSIAVDWGIEPSYGSPERSAPKMGPPNISATAGYNVRALVDGGWGLCSDDELDVDAIVRTARGAVAIARANRPRHRTSLALAPAPVVPNGRWATPIERDPFAIPLREQGEVQRAAMEAVRDIGGLNGASLRFAWTRGISVFASTDGSLIVQRPQSGMIDGSVGMRVDDITTASGIDLLPDTLGGRQWGGFGYEVIRGQASVAEAAVAAAERAGELARASKNRISAEVGRYDVVLGPKAMATVVCGALFPALNLERVLGYRANEEGTSFAGPPEELLGTFRVGSPLLTMRGNRRAPGGAATIGWDTEGVKPEDHVVIKNGVIQDYHTARQSAVALADFYARHGRQLRSNGCASSSDIGPVVNAPNLTIDAGPDGTTIDDLIAGTKRGFYVEELHGRSDQQLLNTQYWLRPENVRQIVNGRLGAYVKDLALQCVTPSLWRGLDGLGDASTVKRVITAFLDPTIPVGDIHVPPGRFRQVNVLNTGRQA